MKATLLRLSEQASKASRVTRKPKQFTGHLEIPPLLAHLCRSIPSKKIPVKHTRIARIARIARAYGKQIPPFTQIHEITPEEASSIAAHLCLLRCKEHQSELSTFPVGRKIGFTNQSIWNEYNVHGPNWGYLYNDTVLNRNWAYGWPKFSLKRVDLEPKIEPEIVFIMAKTPRASMKDSELLDCVSYILHGFEVVDSIFPGWKFEGVDTTIAGGLHSSLLIDKFARKSLSDFGSQTKLLSDLENFEIGLYRNGELQETGRGSNVLGSPIKALRYLVELLSKQDIHPQIQPGEIITTGTLTKAFSISHDDKWHTQITGIDLPGYLTHFKFQPPAPSENPQALERRSFALKQISEYIAEAKARSGSTPNTISDSSTTV